MLSLCAIVAIAILYISEVCQTSEVLVSNFVLSVDSVPTGQPFKSFSTRSKLDCAKFCAYDPQCSTFTAKEVEPMECLLYTCWEAVLQTSSQSGVKTYIKKGKTTSSENYVYER